MIQQDMVMMMDKFHIKTRGKSLTKDEANALGVKRVYNWTSDIDFMHTDSINVWSEGLHDKSRGEAVIVESAMRYVDGKPIYVSTCIVFLAVEMCNLYYMKNRAGYKQVDGFMHLLN